MKNVFEAPEMEVILVDVEDVIAASYPDPGAGGLPII